MVALDIDIEMLYDFDVDNECIRRDDDYDMDIDKATELHVRWWLWISISKCSMISMSITNAFDARTITIWISTRPPNYCTCKMVALDIDIEMLYDFDVDNECIRCEDDYDMDIDKATELLYM
jgi:hypothetical protein